MSRLDDPTLYNPFGWRLARLAASSDRDDDDAGRRLREELLVWEAREIAYGYRHVTVAHGDPTAVVESRRLSAFYDLLGVIVESAGWCRVRGTADYVTITVAGSDAAGLVAQITAAAAAADPEWAVTPSAGPAAA